MHARIFDDRPCTLGEGPLWHPEREQLFWFDIIGRTLCTRVGEREHSWTFDDMVSAAGWVDKSTLLVASETALLRFDIETGKTTVVADLDADNASTRSNDGRADPFGGFWIGTMGKKAEKGAGAIYRFYRGEVRKIVPSVSITNSMCFSIDGRRAFFSDTAEQKVFQVGLDPHTGWLAGQPELFIDFSGENLNPDGAVIDAEGMMWIAQWGAGRIAAYAPDGSMMRTVSVEAPHASCPAFGGPSLTTLFCTTAREGLDEKNLRDAPYSGMTFAAEDVTRGQAEHQVVL
ncbi:SMP-30/gluconolactonase/LRE family protein [Pelagibacterium montanilacus]|uniref:SMP-30/gluconolactonase/LRE family protein n=1 Tax=Pelagibacterium montanilacus TaxID=2185280 RepID=UPI000F8D380A|nr:SMP-30/gluconolactonase/LRE family protein [Pelagibacterium montanilacus]